MCMVRSNNNKENALGFLTEYRRLNVAITRPKRHLITIGDSATLGRDDIFRGLIGYFREYGCII